MKVGFGRTTSRKKRKEKKKGLAWISDEGGVWAYNFEFRYTRYGLPDVACEFTLVCETLSYWCMRP
jgi:hypothetical protein